MEFILKNIQLSFEIILDSFRNIPIGEFTVLFLFVIFIGCVYLYFCDN